MAPGPKAAERVSAPVLARLLLWGGLPTLHFAQIPVSPTLDSRQLLAFSALVRRGSFTLAAQDLGLSQSAVSHAIKTLEDDVGCVLLERRGRRVRLTPAGEQFLRHTEKILREMETARSGLDAWSKSGQSLLRVGASTTACQHILPGVLLEFRAAHPNCAIRLEAGDQAQQLELLRGGHIDLAVGLEPPMPARSEHGFIPLFQDELRFVVAPRHHWAALERVPREAIAAETLVLYSRTSRTFRLISEYFRTERTVLGSFIDLGSMEALVALVKTGQGAGILAPWNVRQEEASGALVTRPLGARRLTRSWGVTHCRGRRLTAAEEAFVGMCVRVSDSLGLEAAAGPA